MIENVSTQLTVFHCFAHCLLPGRAFASLYALLFLEKEAEIGGRDVFTSRGENSVDPDQLASEKPADRDLHCFQNGIISLYSWVHTWQQLSCHKTSH